MTFQFLIGKLKSRIPPAMSCYPLLFQFLIGKLKSRDCVGGKRWRDGFQFLIGKLKSSLFILPYLFAT